MDDSSSPARGPASLIDTLLRTWITHAFDPASGAFISALDPAGAPIDDGRRLCLVQARLLYCCAQAVRLGAGADVAYVADTLHATLRNRFRRADGLYALAVLADGTRDDVADLYDQAFVVFALAHRFATTGDDTARRAAFALLDALDRHLADPAGGYREDTAGTRPRRQNPHMHLLEALLALAEATGDAAPLVRARAIIELFLTRFFDRDTGTLREFMGADFAPLAGAVGAVREPGHHLEWVWLLLHYRRLAGDDRVLTPAERLFETALQHGRDGRGLFVEAMSPTGAVTQPATLLWPQTEAVKAMLARHEFCGAPAAPAWAMWDTLARHHIPGGGPLWINRLAVDGAPLSSDVPTRVLYHLVLCLAEMARLAPEPGPRAC